MARRSRRHNKPTPDAVIAVMGPTGAGKSTFINIATEDDHTKVGHSLESCTKEVQTVPFERRDGSTRKVVFLDTPGFDDTNLTDAEVLIAITDRLNEMYRKGTKLTGLLYLHRISDTRMTGTCLRNSEMFEKLCGPDALQNVLLVTTMWDRVDQETGAMRERELEDDFWKSMITSGSRMVRFHRTHDSAWDILDQLKGSPCAVQLQVEMVDEGKPLMRTAAGRAVLHWLSDFINQLRVVIASIQVRLFGNSRAFNPQELENIRNEALETHNCLESAKEQRNLLSGDPETDTSLPPLTTEHDAQGSHRNNRTSSRRRVYSLSHYPPMSKSPGMGRRGRSAATARTMLGQTSRVASTMVGSLAGVVSTASGIAERIDAMKRTEQSVINLSNTCRTCTEEFTPYAEAVPLPDGVSSALADFLRTLQDVHAVLDGYEDSGPIHRYMLQPADERVLVECNDRIRNALDICTLKCVLSMHQALAVVHQNVAGRISESVTQGVVIPSQH